MFLATVLFLQSLQFQGKKICDNKLDNQRQDILYTNVEGEAVVLNCTSYLELSPATLYMVQVATSREGGIGR